jgi:hypothetical protein
MKFRIAKDAKNNAGKLLDVSESNVHQYENGRVSVTGRISGRNAPWEGSLGTSVTFADADTEAWLLTLGINWKAHGAWVDAYNEEKGKNEAEINAARERSRARAREELAIIQAAQTKFAVAVREGVMQFDGTPQIASVPNFPLRKWVSAWVLVEVSE